MDVNGARVAREGVAPDPLEQLVAREHEPAMVEQLPEQIELLGCEVYGAASDGNAVRGWIDEKVAHLDGAVADALRCASQMGADAGEEFPGNEDC